LSVKDEQIEELQKNGELKRVELAEILDKLKAKEAELDERQDELNCVKMSGARRQRPGAAA